MPDVCHVGYKTAMARWKLAVGIAVEPPASPFLQSLFDYGHKTEAVALGVLQELDVLPTRNASLCALEETGFWVNSRMPSLGATPDGMWCGYDENHVPMWREPVEVKCPIDSGTTLPGSDKFARYKIQLEVQCRVTGAAAGHLFVYGDDLKNCHEDEATRQSSYYYFHEADDALWDIICMYHRRHQDACLYNTAPSRATADVKRPMIKWMEEQQSLFNRRLFRKTKYS